MPGSEIISLQLGHFANHVGAHYWNLQEASFRYDDADGAEESANHDVLFREGANSLGQVTFTPRLLLVDLKGSLGSLRAGTGLYEEVEAPAPGAAASAAWWQGSVSLHAEQPAPRNEFLVDAFGGEGDDESKDGDGDDAKPEAKPEAPKPLEQSVRVWSDFLGVRLHPRSVLLAPGCWLADRRQQFGQFAQGRGLWQREEFGDELEGRLRQFAEECDLLQGFHALCDADDGFGGLAAGLLGHLREEFPKKVVLSLPCCPAPAGGQEAAAYQLNWALACWQLDSLADVVAPLSACRRPWQRTPEPARSYWPLRAQPELPYHSSALLAAWLDTQSFAWRQSAGPRLWDVQQLLCQQQRRLCCASLRLPLALIDGESLYSALRRDASLLPVGPFADDSGLCPGDFLSALSVSRGIEDSLTVDATREPEAARQLLGCRPADLFRRRLEEARPGGLVRHVAYQAAVGLKAPFPPACAAAADGDSGDNLRLPSSTTVWTLAENSCAPANDLVLLASGVESLLKAGRLPAVGGSLEADEVREAAHGLADMAERLRVSL